MSHRTLLDREVSVVPMTDGERDGHGNPTRVAGVPYGPIRARRHLTDASEDTEDRDEQTVTYLFHLELRTKNGELINPSGRDVIQDGDDTFEIIGAPTLATRRRLPHHWEAKANHIGG